VDFHLLLFAGFNRRTEMLDFRDYAARWQPFRRQAPTQGTRGARIRRTRACRRRQWH
jgi:hypothetical protein